MNKLIAAVVAGIVLGGTVALAQTQSKTITYDTATVRIDSFNGSRLADGGFAVSVCASPRTAPPDGGLGVAVHVDAPCVHCEGPLQATTFTSCFSAWRTANGF